MRIATFNLQNLRLRMRDGQQLLDGAVDEDVSGAESSQALAFADRMQTAHVIKEAKADFVGLQEVFDRTTLDYFHDRFLRVIGTPAYPCRYCYPGNDGRGRNVAAMSRYRPVSIKTHACLSGADLGLDDLPPALRDQRLFRRDCLELDFSFVSIFVCHFKAPYPDVAKAHLIREAEARAVRKIVEARFIDRETARWIILGDFNEPAAGQESQPSALNVFRDGFAVDLLDRLAPGRDWTYEFGRNHRHSRPDGLFVSPRLAQEYPDLCPKILRTGMKPTRVHRTDDAHPPDRPHASDHALVYADFTHLEDTAPA
jgi:endonuclease/exonuclease/phosphatase family metal-dependent hydrolase